MVNVEVFRTNVMMKVQAVRVADVITKALPSCNVNFDLDDCDRVLRVVSTRPINCDLIIHLVNGCGFAAEVLPDLIEDPAHLQLMAS
jgi:hypothetical protein